MSQEEQAVEIWKRGVAAVGGYDATLQALPEVSKPDAILAVGKAAAAMARAALDHFGQIDTLVVTKDGHGDGLPDYVRTIEAAHPVPDARSLAGGQALRQAVEGLGPDAHVLLLVSGGASSLAEDLVDGKTLSDLAALNQHLLSTGMDIGAMNEERRKLSRIKGAGLLSGFTGARATVLAISDVPGDDLRVIGSGIGALPDAPAFQGQARIIASNAHARRAAAEAAIQAGYTVLADEEALHDDYLSVSAALGARLRDMEPGAMIFGGEPTVILPKSPGRGGRNQALGLALAKEIAGCPGITLVVGGTDGTDGPTDAAGAVVDGTTWSPEAEDALLAADSGTYLHKNQALLTTGPTGTNVMDLVVALKR